MAVGCDGCVATNLGFSSEADYVALLGADCLAGAQGVYCVSGVPSVPPRGCDNFFGECRSDKSPSGGQYLVPEKTLSARSSDPLAALPNNIDTPLVVTNTSCYPMVLSFDAVAIPHVWINADPGTAAAPANPFWMVNQTFIDGVLIPVTELAGASLLYGNGTAATNYRNESSYTIGSTHLVGMGISGLDALGQLGPGETITVSNLVGIIQVPANTDIRVHGWVSAVRVSGGTTCPVI
jgi:hypothetical protein